MDRWINNRPRALNYPGHSSPFPSYPSLIHSFPSLQFHHSIPSHHTPYLSPHSSNLSPITFISYLPQTPLPSFFPFRSVISLSFPSEPNLSRPSPSRPLYPSLLPSAPPHLTYFYFPSLRSPAMTWTFTLRGREFAGSQV